MKEEVRMARSVTNNISKLLLQQNLLRKVNSFLQVFEIFFFYKNRYNK